MYGEVTGKDIKKSKRLTEKQKKPNLEIKREPSPTRDIIHRELSAYEKLNLFVIACTGLVIIWYTKETFDLKEQGRKALLSSVQPLLIVFRCGPYLAIKNSGRGIAKNIEWQTISGGIKVKSDPENYPGIIEPFPGGMTTKDVVTKNLIAYQIAYEGTGSIRLSYQDERNNDYYSDIEISKENIRLLKTGSSRDFKHKSKT